MAAEVGWDELVGIPAGTAVDDLRFAPHHVALTLFQCRADGFIIAVRSKSAQVAGARLASALMWAPDVSAARRALFLEVEGDEGREGLPPSEMMLSPDAVSYSAILKAARSKRGDVLESAQYRVATDGRFVQRVIRCSPWVYYFRSRTGGRERPFAASRDLKAQGQGPDPE
ncbi:hypothetical protein [Anaeromyxobacter sp. Fw109-5]|uniref:hypothetical protein n=1 Tax=Anaeromyxobacter sp. (strain Fw109-5) TaxID=404589 RepID=UPI00059DE8FB|nr:hypothetical protein [Anaeromyxobacter sp. Fw109-5]